jgi:hypothetical protein
MTKGNEIFAAADAWKSIRCIVRISSSTDHLGHIPSCPVISADSFARKATARHTGIIKRPQSRLRYSQLCWSRLPVRGSWVQCGGTPACAAARAMPYAATGSEHMHQLLTDLPVRLSATSVAIWIAWTPAATALHQARA